MLTASRTRQGITGTADVPLFFGGTRSRGWGRWGLVTGVGDGGALHPRGGGMQHAVRTNQCLRPRVWAEQAGRADQLDGLNNQVVEVLPADLELGGLVHRDLGPFGMLPQRREEMAHAAFGRKDPRRETKAFGIVSIAFLRQVLEGLGPRPTIGQLPAIQQEEGDRIKRFISAGGDPAKALRQHRTQAGVVDEPQSQIEIAQVFPGGRIVQVGAAAIDIVGAIGLLGGRRRAERSGPVQRHASAQMGPTACVHELRIVGTLVRGGEVRGHGGLGQSATNGGRVLPGLDSR